MVMSPSHLPAAARLLFPLPPLLLISPCPLFLYIYFLVHQAAAACCQNEATSVDCLANAAYMNFYDCRLQNDVGGDCTGLSCDAVGTAIFETPAPADADVDANADDAAEDEDVDTASENAAGLVAPSSLTSGISAVFVMAGLLAGAMKVL